MKALNNVPGYKGNLSSEAVKTFGNIAQSIIEHGNMNAWDRANNSMRAALMQVKRNSNGKAEFLVKAKKETGIVKNSHPLLAWCVENWKF